MRFNRTFHALFLIGAGLTGLNAEEVLQDARSTEVEITGEARIIGEIADGTPPPPPIPPELPDFRVEDSMVRQLPDRKVTLRRVDDPGLPPLPPPPKPMTEEEWKAFQESPEYQTFLAEAREHARRTQFAFLSATVYDRENTRLEWWMPGDSETHTKARNFVAWSNVDFLYLGGFGSYEYNGIEYMLIMAVGNIETEVLEKWQELAAEHGVEYEIPKCPELPADRPAYIVTEGDPTDTEGVALMDGLHVLYIKEKDRLIAAYESREKARIEREAYLKANPPKPKDLILHFWKGQRMQPQPGGAK
ncbi:MAG: hypothetical protein ACO3JG_07690 [Luteolibacter sp.]